MSQTAPTPVDALPAAPSTSAPSTFAALADAFVAALATFRTQINAIATNVYDNAVDAYANAVAAYNYKIAAAIGTNFKGNYSAQTGAANVPYSVYHLSKYWTLLSNLADVTTKVPGTDVEWAAIATGTAWVRKTANYTAVSGDGVLADTSAGAFTVTLPASPTAGSYVEVLDPEGTWATNNLTIARNAQPIMGIAENMVCSENNDAFVLVFDDGTNGWRLA